MQNRDLLVLGCSQTKREAAGLLPAIDRYDGSAYRVLRNYLREQQWPSNLSVAVLSARYGLVGGFTGIEDYDQRMSPSRAAELAPTCSAVLDSWIKNHQRVHFSLGKDYLPAVAPAIENVLKEKAEVFEGPIGIKLQQIKSFLQSTQSPRRHMARLPQPGGGAVSYFLPDWDDLLDENFDFSTDSFSGKSPSERGDKHCSVFMKPDRIFDGILVSLAQHVTPKGSLRRIIGTEQHSLAPKNLRQQFLLEEDQSLFGDCGAFSYANEQQPTLSVEQAIALYDLHGFDFGASVDHIPVGQIVQDGKLIETTLQEKSRRVELTKSNAEHFLEISRKRNVSFRPVGTVQSLDSNGYADTVRFYHDIGYRYIALGGLVPQSDAAIKEIVLAVMRTVSELKPRPWVHLFGIFRPKLQELFRKLKVDSFDSATYFRKAWLRSGQNYLGADGKWYAAIRVPMTRDPRTRKRLEGSGADIAGLEIEEIAVMELLEKYCRREVSVEKVLDGVLHYDENLTRSSEVKSLREAYRKTLENRPWDSCGCGVCSKLGIHVIIFRGANRNKRRGTHNTLLLYRSLGQ
jgi:hypothetical protein